MFKFDLKFDKAGSDPIPRENPFRAIVKMFKTSIGRLPAHLVIIFIISLALTVLCGLVMEFAGKNDARNVYLPIRLTPEEGQPALADSALTGVWVHATRDEIATLRIGNGIFELVSRSTSGSYSRYFIRGGYKIEGNVLALQERKDMGTPYDPDHIEYKFYPMNFKNMNVYVDHQGQLMTWRTPKKEARRLENTENILKIIFGENMVWARISARP